MKRKTISEKLFDRVCTVIAAAIFLSWMIGFSGGIILQNATLMISGMIAILLCLTLVPLILLILFENVRLC